VWGPGDQGFDELLVQYNGLGDEFWAIMDAGGDLVALCDLGGSGGAARVVGQWTYDAYGAVLSADHLYAMAQPHLGHKGLFVDRLDVGIVTSTGGPESPRLVPFADANYHVRNRSYQPKLGRWLQRDPNATGVAVADLLVSGGQVQVPSVSVLDLESLYGDGHNLNEYLGSNTWERADELGLFFGYDDLALGIVGGLRGALGEMVGQYADNALADVEWAMDWEMGDDWHTRSDNSWVELSFAFGFYRGMLEQVETSLLVDQLEFAGRAGVAGKAAKAARRVRSMRDLNRRKIYPSYDVARRAIEKGSGEHAHKLVELQMGGPWRTRLARTGPCIHVESHFHLSNVRVAFNQAYKDLKITNPRRMNQKQAEAVIKKVYAKAPRLRNESLKYIRGK